MNKLLKTVCSLLLGIALALQLVSPAALAEDRKKSPVDEKLPIQVMLRVPVYEKGKDGKEKLKLDDKGQPVFQDVADPEKTFGKDSGLTVSIQGKPKQQTEDSKSDAVEPSPSPSEEPKSKQPEVTLKLTVEDLQKNGLYILPPAGYFVEGLYLIDAATPVKNTTATDPGKQSTELTVRKNLTALAEADPENASIYLRKELFLAENKEQDEKTASSIFPKGAKELVLIVEFGRLNAKEKIDIRYLPGAYECEDALFDEGDTVVLDKSHKLRTLSDEQLKRADEQGLEFRGWLLSYSEDPGPSKTLSDNESKPFPPNGSTLLLQPGDEISPYMSCLLIAQWTKTEEPEVTPEPTAEPTAEPTPEPTAEPTPEPTAEPTPEPTTEPTPEPKAEPTPEPKAEPTPEPTAEPTPEPTAEPTPEPTVQPTKLTITLKSGVVTEKIYDGTPLKLSESDFSVSGLPAGAACELELSATGEPVKGGESVELTVKIKSVRADGKVLDPASYSCEPLKLRLSILKRSVNVSATAEKVYDDNALSLSTAASVVYGTGIGELLSGHRVVSANSAATLTDAGSSSAAIDAASVRIVDESGADVTENYQVIGGSATLTVTRRPLTIRTSSAVKLYDGSALTDHSTPVVTGLISGHRIPITFTGKQEKVGSSANTIKTDFKITCGDRDVTKNYDISYIFGTLTVLDASAMTYVKGSNKDITLHLDVDYSDFRDLLLDNVLVEADKYSCTEGSTVIKLKASWLEGLSVGTYSLKIRYKTANDMKLDLTVKKAGEQDPTKPKTGDNSQLGLFAALSAGSLIVLAVLIVMLRKKQLRSR